MPEPFGNLQVPFAEPAWYNSLKSPIWTEKHIKLRNHVRAFYEEHVMPYAQKWEESGEVPQSIFDLYAREGYIAAAIPDLAALKPLLERENQTIKLPADIPCEEWDIGCSVVVTDESARSGYLGAQWAFSGGNAIGAPPIAAFGTDEQKRKFLLPIIRGEKRICLGITEPSGGSDVAGLKTTAEKTADGKHYIVNGYKKWITNGVFADYITAAVRTGGKGHGGISLLIIPTDAPGVSRDIIKNTGVNASGSTLFEFEDVKVPVENLIGEENKGFHIIMTNFLKERLTLCVQAIRMSRVCLEDSYEYATERYTFGKPLIQQPIIRDKLSNMARTIEANQAWVESVIYHMMNTPKAQADLDLAGTTALMKVSCTRGLEFCSRESLQVFGGAGYQRGGRGGRVEQISRDLRVTAVGGGSEEIMLDLGLRMGEKLLKSKAKASL